jgi:hypothetical protein
MLKHLKEPLTMLVEDSQLDSLVQQPRETEEAWL